MAKKIEDGQKLVSDRRDFLKFASMGAVASGVSAVAGSAAAEEITEGVGKGYQNSKHVQKYYELTKF